MPLRTGVSHAGAALSSLLLSVTIATYVEQYALVGAVTSRAGALAAAAFCGAVSADYVGALVVSAALSFLWGIAYHLRRFDKP